MQLLWDRGEGNGYAHNLTTDPLDNTPPHEVLLQAALGDHQVANITAEVEARTVGAAVYDPALEAGRHWEDDPFMDLTAGAGRSRARRTRAAACSSTTTAARSASTGTRGQGTATPPNENVPPRHRVGLRRRSARLPAGGRRRPAAGGLVPRAATASRAAPTPDGYCFSNGWTGAP